MLITDQTKLVLLDGVDGDIKKIFEDGAMTVDDCFTVIVAETFRLKKRITELEDKLENQGE